MDKNKCNSCGEAPHKCSCKNKEFTKAVIEIDNPEQIILFRKVVIPESLGDDTAVPPAVGKYRNVLLKYEANNRVYIYSSDGIPTLLEMDVPQEVWDSIDELQEEIDAIPAPPTVVQTTGTSTTDVMSQKAVTDSIPLVFTTNEWNALWT